jgi:hypothetical protein
VPGDGERQQRVGEVVTAGDRQPHLGVTPRGDRGGADPGRGVEADVTGVDVGAGVVDGDTDHPWGGGGHRSDPVVGDVEYGHPVRTQGLDELALRVRDRLDRAEDLQVRLGNGGDDGDVGGDHRREAGDVTGVACTDLGDDDLGVGPHRQEGERDAEFVVVRPAGRVDPASGADRRGGEVLDGGLADRPGHRDGGCTDGEAVGDGEVAQPLPGVADDDLRDRTGVGSSTTARVAPRRTASATWS